MVVAVVAVVVLLLLMLLLAVDDGVAALSGNSKCFFRARPHLMASSGLTSTAAPQTKQGGTPYTRSARCRTRTDAK